MTFACLSNTWNGPTEPGFTPGETEAYARRGAMDAYRRPLLALANILSTVVSYRSYSSHETAAYLVEETTALTMDGVEERQERTVNALLRANAR